MIPDIIEIVNYKQLKNREMEKKKLNEISDNDVQECQSILNLKQIPDSNYAKRTIANMFTKGWLLRDVSGLQIIQVYNYLKDKYELPV